MGQRIPRKKLSKKVWDFSKPIPLDLIGSKDDPCFGKHYDSKDEICGACGDSELCLIAMAQNNSSKRMILEKSNTYKDIEQDIPDEKNPQIMIPKKIKLYKKKGYTFKKAYRKLVKLYGEKTDKSWVKRLYKNLE